jgi:hypothetical protein
MMVLGGPTGVKKSGRLPSNGRDVGDTIPDRSFTAPAASGSKQAASSREEDKKSMIALAPVPRRLTPGVSVLCFSAHRNCRRFGYLSLI